MKVDTIEQFKIKEWLVENFEKGSLQIEYTDNSIKKMGALLAPIFFMSQEPIRSPTKGSSDWFPKV